MLETLKKEWQAQIAVLLLLVLTAWWFLSPTVRDANFAGARFFGDFPSIYAIMALWGAVWGIVVSLKWGGWKSVVGRALLFFSGGLLAQVFGQLVYAYLSFYQHMDVPYPSLGDVGYFGSIPLYVLAVVNLAHASGVKITLNLFLQKLQAIIIPLVLLAVGYFLFLQGYKFDWSDPVKVFLDFGYPLGQAFYISLAIITYLFSRGMLGGVMKSKILFILFALLIQFLSDYTFLYQSSKGTWSAGGLNDFMYLIAYFAMTLGLLQLKTMASKLQRGNSEVVS